jgi:4-amino-4-deoxy-L-arabinose transferase-like glycosyltransferase
MATALLLLLTIPLRLLFLGADPPADVQRHFFWDEGLWAHNARVHELFGVWVVDDHNPPLVLAPLYTMVLTAFYQVFGLGLIPTRLVSATSGILSCLILYGAARAIRTPGRALGAALVFTLSYFVMTFQRLAFTEAHQLLWAVVGLAGVLWARRQPRWALLAGLGITLAQLVKPSAFFLFPTVLGYWLWRGSQADGEPSARIPVRVEIAWFSAGVALVAVPVAAVVLANWSLVWGYLVVSLRSIRALTETLHVELIAGVFGLPPRGFALQSIVQVAAAGVLAWQRVLRSREDHPDAIERIAWIWLGLGLLTVGLLRFQPDRRFLLLSAPLAILFATAVECRVGSPAPSRVLPGGSVRRFTGGALLGFAVGWVTIALCILMGIRVAPPRWSLLWNVAVVCGGLVSLLRPLHLTRVVAMCRPSVLIMGFLILEPIRFSLHLAQPQYSVLAATRRLAALANDLPSEDRVMVGEGSSTLSLESTILAIPMRINPATGAFLNQNPWDRFHPALALAVIRRGMPHAEAGEAGKRGFRPCMTFDLLPDGHGGRYRRMELWIRPDLAGHCEALARPGGDAQKHESADSVGKGS